MDKVELAGVFIRNMPTFFEIAAIQIQEKITNIGEYFATIPANAKLMGEYIANNWRKLIADALDATATGFMNLGENIWQAFHGDPELLLRGRDGTSTSPLYFRASRPSSDQLPELIKPKLTSMQDAIDERLAIIAERENSIRKPFEHQAKKKEETAAAVAARSARREVQERDPGCGRPAQQDPIGYIQQRAMTPRSNRSSYSRRSPSHRKKRRKPPRNPKRRHWDERHQAERPRALAVRGDRPGRRGSGEGRGYRRDLGFVGCACLERRRTQRAGNELGRGRGRAGWPRCSTIAPRASKGPRESCSGR